MMMLVGLRPLISTTLDPTTPLEFVSLSSCFLLFFCCKLLRWLNYAVSVVGQGACVQNVLDSVISSLLEDQNRKFIYVEMVIIILIISYTTKVLIFLYNYWRDFEW